MNTEVYKNRLLELEKNLTARAHRDIDRARENAGDASGDMGDLSVADENTSVNLNEAERDAEMLQQVRDALGRIADGTFGQCIADGEPIEAKRLEASPWTPLCLKHQAQREGPAGKRSTL